MPRSSQVHEVSVITLNRYKDKSRVCQLFGVENLPKGFLYAYSRVVPGISDRRFISLRIESFGNF